jgi:hypothetical protein
MLAGALGDGEELPRGVGETGGLGVRDATGGWETGSPRVVAQKIKVVPTTTMAATERVVESREVLIR